MLSIYTVLFISVVPGSSFSGFSPVPLSPSVVALWGCSPVKPSDDLPQAPQPLCLPGAGPAPYPSLSMLADFSCKERRGDLQSHPRVTLWPILHPCKAPAHFFRLGFSSGMQHVKWFSWPSSLRKQQLPCAGNAALLRLTEITDQTKIGRDTNNEMAKQRVGSNSWNVMGLKICIQRILFVLLNNANILAFGLEKCSNRLTCSPISRHVY